MRLAHPSMYFLLVWGAGAPVERSGSSRAVGAVLPTIKEMFGPLLVLQRIGLTTAPVDGKRFAIDAPAGIECSDRSAIAGASLATFPLKIPYLKLRAFIGAVRGCLRESNATLVPGGGSVRSPGLSGPWDQNIF